MGSDHVQATSDSRSEVTRLLKVIDELAKDYPDIEDYIGVRSSAGAGGTSGGLAVPVNLEVLSFLNSNYWVGPEVAPGADVPPPDEHTVTPPPCASWSGERTGPRCGRCGGCVAALDADACTYEGCGADPDHWRAGLKPTIFGLERSVRSVLGFGAVRRDRGTYAGHGRDPHVEDALRWLAKSAHTLVDDYPQVARTVRQELARVGGRAHGMIHGGKLQVDRTWNQCQYCHLTSVVSDQERAVCTTVYCRRPDGTRHCWQLDDDGEWQEIDEPDGRYGRGQNLSDIRVEELTREADEIRRAAGTSAQNGHSGPSPGP